MSSDTLMLELEPDSLFRSMIDRLRFSEAAEVWARCRQNLTRWEDEHLLVEKPKTEDLERHRKIVERLMFFGRLFGLVAAHPEFNDLETVEMIHANQFILREKFLTFHNPMEKQQADHILKEVFPES